LVAQVGDASKIVAKDFIGDHIARRASYMNPHVKIKTRPDGTLLQGPDAKRAHFDGPFVEYLLLLRGWCAGLRQDKAQNGVLSAASTRAI
jgi:hypothetical protein